jgi:geranylgeranyl diphosphate synthase type II
MTTTAMTTRQNAPYPVELRDLVEEYLADMRFSAHPDTDGLEDAMRYSLLAGGKRLRPVLVLATARALGLDPAVVLPLAAAVELIHTYSLIHDDLPAMDNDDLRRGRPTSHRVYGEGMAILAGDALMAEAFCHVVTHQRGEPAAVLAAVRELADAAGTRGMAGGQHIDLQAQSLGTDAIRRMDRLKTGRLFEASVSIVLALMQVDEEAGRPWREFAEGLGQLFQIVDDILDVTAADEDIGKPAGSDARNGKRTYVSELGLCPARGEAAAVYASARARLSAAVGRPESEMHRVLDFVYGHIASPEEVGS